MTIDSQDPPAQFRSAGLRYGNRDLPHPSDSIPPYRIKDPAIRAKALKETTIDFSKGVYRLCARLSRIGKTLYLCGAEVVDPANVTDEVVVGTIHET